MVGSLPEGPRVVAHGMGCISGSVMRCVLQGPGWHKASVVKGCEVWVTAGHGVEGRQIEDGHKGPGGGTRPVGQRGGSLAQEIREVGHETQVWLKPVWGQEGSWSQG